MVGGSDGGGAYRWTLSPTLVTPSLTLSVVDLEPSGVILSEISVVMVSNSSSSVRVGVNELSPASLRPESIVVYGVD